MQSSLKSYLSKILFLLLFINSAIYSVDFEGQIALETLKTEGITAIKLALAQYQTNGHAPILINIGSEIIPTQIVETIGKSKREITEEVTQAVSRSLGEMYSLPETDVKKLHKELCSQKEKFTDFEVDTRGVGRARDRFNAIHDSTIGPIKAANRAEAEAKLERKIKNFKNKIKEAHGDKNQERLDEFWSIIIGFIDCNSIDMPRRIDARIHLSKISQCDPDIFG